VCYGYINETVNAEYSPREYFMGMVVRLSVNVVACVASKKEDLLSQLFVIVLRFEDAVRR